MTTKEFIEYALNEGLDKIEITEKKKQSEWIKYRNEERKQHEITIDKIYYIKGEQNKKTVKLITNYLEEEIVNNLKLQLKYIESTNEDSYLKSTIKNISSKEEKDEVDINKVEQDIQALIKQKKSLKEVEKIEICYQKNKESIHIINSNGVDLSSFSKSYTFSVEVLAMRKDQKSVARRTVESTTDMDKTTLTDEVVEEAIIRLDQRLLENKKYNVLFQSQTATSLIKAIMKGLSAEEVEKKTTIWKDKLKKQIATPIVTIIEDPTNHNYPGYRLFDDEGTKTYKKKVVDKGILQTFFYNNKTAIKEKKKSTGNEYGGINTANLYVEKGEKSFKELLNLLNEGIVITSYAIALDAIKLEEGKISIQIFGYYVKDGKIISGFIPAILTTTFQELLENIIAIGNDLTFSERTTGSPSLLVEGLSVASKEKE